MNPSDRGLGSQPPPAAGPGAPTEGSGAPPGPLPMWRFAGGVLLVGIGSGCFAILFRALLTFTVAGLYGAEELISAMRSLPVGARLLSPAVGGLCAGLFSRISARIGSSHGVGDVMEAVVLGRVRLSMRVTLLRSLASFCAIVSGGSLGREGPLIQFGGAAGQWIGNRLRLPASQSRRLIAAGAAAGFAAAYNTPFAAVLFVIEVVTGVVVLDAILPALIATTIATALARASVGEGPIYGQRGFYLQAPLELVAFAPLGVAAALVAQAFMRLLSFAEQQFRLRAPDLPWRPAVGGVLAGACVALVPEVAGNGYEPLNLLLDGEFVPSFVLLLVAGKIVSTSASVGSGNPGGVFTPTLLIGGTTGFLYAYALTSFTHIGPAGGYVLVGMAAATAATIHAPLMAAVMVFELSGDYAIVLPLVLATALATLVSRRLRRDSLYSAELKRRGVGWELTLEGGRRVARRSLPP